MTIGPRLNCRSSGGPRIGSNRTATVFCPGTSSLDRNALCPLAWETAGVTLSLMLQQLLLVFLCLAASVKLRMSLLKFEGSL